MLSKSPERLPFIAPFTPTHYYTAGTKYSERRHSRSPVFQAQIAPNIGTSLLRRVVPSNEHTREGDSKRHVDTIGVNEARLCHASSCADEDGSQEHERAQGHPVAATFEPLVGCDGLVEGFSDTVDGHEWQVSAIRAEYDGR